MIRPIILPPKRYEDHRNPKYDAIRHKKWFSGLERARQKLPSLEFADMIYMTNSAISATAAAAECLVPPSDLYEYRAFKAGKSKLTNETSKVFQRVLDEAYLAYCEDNADKSFTNYIITVAKVYGINPRHITEVWDTDPNFYPRGYK